nr:MAG: capsid protein [Wufeng shrew marnavirus 1]
MHKESISLKPQSEDEVVQETTTFQENDGTGDVMDMPATHLPLILDDAVTQADLKSFLARPVRITAGTWFESDSTGLSLFGVNPWFSFFNEARIKNKLHNFAFVRCNLKIKILVNASPFYYGRALVHYRPTTAFKSQVPLNTAANTQLVPFSQRPHVWLRAEDNTGGEMTLPFVYQKNWLTIKSATEMQQMGTLSANVYSPLQSANGVAGTGVSYSIYAWAEDVVLSGSTLSLAMQGKDEYVDGPISGPATALSKIAGSLTPVFGRFATATSMALSTTADIARMFGFTNVPVVSSTAPMRVTQFANFASTEIGYPLEKLTIDAKNELSVDPKVLGLSSDDELVVSDLVSRDSYLTKFVWATTDTLGKTLFYSNVTPRMQSNTIVDTTTNVIQHTPMSFVARAFEAWRGDIIFEFDIVASQYHKGRLQIAFDPVGDATTNVVNTSDVTSAVYTVVADLSKEHTVSIRVPYQQALGWLTTQATSEVVTAWSTSATPTFVDSPTQYNGSICVKVLNNLTAPVLTSNVEVLVRVRGAENLEFANPAPFRSTLSYFRPQSEEEIVMDVLGAHEPSLDEKRGLLNYGEVVRSLRPLIRRTCYATPVNFVVTGSTGYTSLDFDHYKLPPYPGFDPTGLFTVTSVVSIGTKQYNWGNMSLLQWLLPAFVGYRGSTFWYYNPHGQTVASNNLIVTRIPNNVSNASISVTNALSATQSGRAQLQMKEFTASGTSLCNPRVAAGSGISVPMQSQYLMHSTDPQYATTPSNFDTAYADCVNVSIADSAGLIPVTSTTLAPSLDTYCGAGTDFNMHFFLCVPTVYYNATIPVPV